MASGLADIAMYEGRFADAVRILAPAAAADVAAKEPDAAATKFSALAYAYLLQNQKELAIGAAQNALANSSIPKVRFMSARTLVEGGDVAGAQALSTSLGGELQPEPQAYAKIIEGLVALKNGKAREALKPL